MNVSQTNRLITSGLVEGLKSPLGALAAIERFFERNGPPLESRIALRYLGPIIHKVYGRVCVDHPTRFLVESLVQRESGRAQRAVEVISEVFELLNFNFKASEMMYAYIKFLCWSLAGVLESNLKYQTVYISAKGLGQTEFPKRPVDFNGAEHRLLGRDSSETIKLYLYNKKSCKSSFARRLAYSLLQCKRGMLPVADEFKAREVQKHHKTVCTKHVPSENFSDSISFEIKRTVREVFGKPRTRDRDPEWELPSLNGHYSYGRNKGGAFGYVYKRLGLSSCYASRGLCFKELTAMLDLGKLGVHCVYVHVDPSDVEREFRSVFREALLKTKCHAKAYPVLEPFKVRMITAGDEQLYWVARSWQVETHRRLREVPVFRFTGLPCSEHEMDRLLGLFPNLPDTRYISADYSSATDNLDPDYSELALHEICSALGHSLEYESICRVALTRHVVHYDHLKLKFEGEAPVKGSQKWGQMMGSPISFIILCILNAAVCRAAIEQSYDRTFSLWDCPLRVNGDDAAFAIRERDYGGWKSLTQACGLEFSAGKNYVSRDFLMINSELYHVRRLVDFYGSTVLSSRFEPFINMGLMRGQNRVLENQRDEKVFGRQTCHAQRGDDSLSAKAHELVLGHGKEMQDRLLSKMLLHMEDDLKVVPKGMSWFLPRQLGGLGLPITREVEFSLGDRRLAAYVGCHPNRALLSQINGASGDIERVSFMQFAMQRQLDLADMLGLVHCYERFADPQFIVDLPLTTRLDFGAGWEREKSDARGSTFRMVLAKALKAKLSPMSLYKIRSWSNDKLTWVINTQGGPQDSENRISGISLP